MWTRLIASGEIVWYFYYKTQGRGCRGRLRTCDIGVGAGGLGRLTGRHCAFVVGIDQTRAEIEIAKKRFRVPGKVEFEVMDAFDMAAVLQLQKRIGRKFNKVFIDINGSRDIGTVCDCMDKYQKVLAPDLIVLKSIKLRYAARVPCQNDKMRRECLAKARANDGKIRGACGSSLPNALACGSGRAGHEKR